MVLLVRVTPLSLSLSLSLSLCVCVCVSVCLPGLVPASLCFMGFCFFSFRSSEKKRGKSQKRKWGKYRQGRHTRSDNIRFRSILWTFFLASDGFWVFFYRPRGELERKISNEYVIFCIEKFWKKNGKKWPTSLGNAFSGPVRLSTDLPSSEFQSFFASLSNFLDRWKQFPLLLPLSEMFHRFFIADLFRSNRGYVYLPNFYGPKHKEGSKSKLERMIG